MRTCLRIPLLGGCKRPLHTPLCVELRRSLSSGSHERIEVGCGSAGSVAIDLHNIATRLHNSPLFIHMPPFPSDGSQPPAPLPGFLRDMPVASINYRWTSFASARYDSDAVASRWPTPVHDTSFAYSWLVENLAPEGLRRRDIYVYGSHMGASLATSLALTETQPHKPFAVRGVICYNGIYNWTMFLPDHPINKPPKRVKNPPPVPELPKGSYLRRLQDVLPMCFRDPVDMFDPFASPSLFFHNPGILVPESYTISGEEAAAIEAIEALVDPEAALLRPPPKVPRKSHLIFPPRTSTLKIPETLLLCDSPVVVSSARKGRRPRSATYRGHTLGNQALELTELMRRSLDKVELKERRLWDQDVDSWEDEEERRVQVYQIGEEKESPDLGSVGEELITHWLDERIGGQLRNDDGPSMMPDAFL